MNYRNYLILISCLAEKSSPYGHLKVVFDEEVSLPPHREPDPCSRSARWGIGGKGDEDCSEVDRSLLRRRRKGDHPSGAWCNLFDVSAGQGLISSLS
jgi:hypothetical protein